MGNPLRSGGLIGEADGAIGDGAAALLCRSWAAPQPRAARRCPPAAGPPGLEALPTGRLESGSAEPSAFENPTSKAGWHPWSPRQIQPGSLQAHLLFRPPAISSEGQRFGTLSCGGGAEAAARQRQKPRSRVLGLSLGGCSHPALACGSSLTVTCQIHLRDIHWAAGKRN